MLIFSTNKIKKPETEKKKESKRVENCNKWKKDTKFEKLEGSKKEE
jgi:hypothetical protein